MPKLMTYTRREQEIQAFISLCFARTERDGLKHVANHSGLSLSTLYRLRRGCGSLHTKVGTVQALGSAAKLRLILTPYRALVRLEK